MQDVRKNVDGSWDIGVERFSIVDCVFTLVGAISTGAMVGKKNFIQKYRRSDDLPYFQSLALAVVAFGPWYPMHTLNIMNTPKMLLFVSTLKAKCSKKCAVPFVLSVSALEPASIQTPTVDVWAQGECSVAI